MIQKFDSTRVSTLSIDATRFQALTSIPKVLMMIEKFGADSGPKMVMEKRVLGSLLPNPITVVQYPCSFTLLSPQALTLPFFHRGCSWHFFNDRHWLFPQAASETFLSAAIVGLTPTTSISTMFTLFDMQQLSVKQVWGYLSLVTAAINHFLGFVTSPASFANKDGVVDVTAQIKALVLTNLIFADLTGFNNSVDSYHRTIYSNLIIDKIANFARGSGLTTKSEASLALGFYGLRYKKILADIFSHAADPENFEALDALTKCLLAFDKVHDEVRNSFGLTQEDEILKVLRNLRNLNHGTFLDREKFEKTALISPDIAPQDLSSIPLLLLLGLFLDPRKFFEE